MIGVVLLSVCWTMPAHATIDWVEGFEYANDAALGAVWSYSCLGNPGVSTLRPRNGTKSLRLVYNGVAGVDPGAGGCFIDRNLAAPGETLYIRYYTYLENFTANSVGTKINFHGNVGFYPSFWWDMTSSRLLWVAVQGIILDNGTRNTENVYTSGVIPQNQWACVELRETMSTPGVDNGILQAWINGVQVLNKTNQRMRPATSTGTPPASPTANFTFVRLYTQHGLGVIYYDDYAVSRDARIGCTASPSGDGQAPRAPSDFSFR
jgi:hypothetical protein